jgi:hypothetical protein
MIRLRHRHGFSIMEYFVLLMVIMGALFACKDMILRALAGKWKSGSDQWSFGRQFHPTDTVECAFDPVYTNTWYEYTCFENKNCPPGNEGCERLAIVACNDSAYCKHNEKYDYTPTGILNTEK